MHFCFAKNVWLIVITYPLKSNFPCKNGSSPYLIQKFLVFFHISMLLKNDKESYKRGVKAMPIY